MPGLPKTSPLPATKRGVLLAALLRDRGRTRVLARELLTDLPTDVAAHSAAQRLFVALAPWPVCPLATKVA